MKKIGTIIGATLAGIFVGVASNELLHRNPQLLKNAWESTKNTLRVFSDAFREGYRGKLPDNEQTAREDKKLLRTAASD